jgi:predicted deacylase
VDEVLAQTDYMMDFHGGGFGRVMGDVTYGYDFPEPTVVEASKEMAKAYGWPLIRRADVCKGFPGPKSSFGYAGGVMNIPNIGPEIGGAGFDDELEEYWIGVNLKGTVNVMRHLEMLPGEVEYLDRYLLWEKRWRVNPSVGGYLLPEFKVADHRKAVSKGQVLGRVVSPYTYEELEVLRSPGDGVVFYCCRSKPVRPGDWAYGVIDTSYPGTGWVRPDEF